MKNEHVFFLCTALAAAGLILLGFALSSTPPLHSSIPDLDEGHLGKKVEVKGEINSIYRKKGNIFLSICSGNCIKAVIFKRTALKLSSHEQNLFLLKKGTRIRAQGQLKEYRGELEIIIDSIEVIK
jgi:DNA/RNA endonuclease YhcR with UshA esterase domain